MAENDDNHHHHGNDDDDNDDPTTSGRLLHDMNYYLEHRCLREEHDASLSLSNVADTNRRLRNEATFVEGVYRQAFGKEDDRKEQERQRILASYVNREIRFATADGGVVRASLASVAASCDAVFSIAGSAHFFRDLSNNKQRNKDVDGGSTSNNMDHHDNDNGADGENCGDKDDEGGIDMSLEDYTEEVVQAFVEVATKQRKVEKLLPDHIAPCCQLGHYLQCQRVVDETAQILMDSIDTANCFSILQLADQLQLSMLFERSLQHVMDSLSELEEHEVWNDLPGELRARLRAIQDTITSNAIGPGNKRVYFSSIKEYLAIFTENVRYSRERLAEARERQAEVTPGGRAWMDAEKKIAKQEKKVGCLESVLAEHKRLLSDEKSDRRQGATDTQERVH